MDGGTKTWVHDVNHSLAWNEETNPFKQTDITFHVMVHIAEEAGERSECFQDLEGQGMKETLAAMENEGTGKVPLSKFCGHSFHEGWEFSES